MYDFADDFMPHLRFRYHCMLSIGVCHVAFPELFKVRSFCYYYYFEHQNNARISLRHLGCIKPDKVIR